VSAYDWFGSIAMLPLATALAGPAESALGRTNALWGCAALIVLVTAVVLCVPEVRELRRRTPPVTVSPSASASASVPRPATEPGPVPGTVTAPGAPDGT
jgi:hypothetical protein